MKSFSNNPATIQISNTKTNEEDTKQFFNIQSNSEERKYLQISLVDYETYVKNKGVSLSFYLSNAFLTIVNAPS